jgi:hypothetical protein
LGLDQYARTIPKELVGDIEVDLEQILIIPDDSVIQLTYWRKFNALHGWMQKLYLEKGGANEEFNCATVRLMSEDLDTLESDAHDKTLEPTAGSFFGDSESPFSDEDRDNVLEFIEQARAAIKSDLAVVYSSWW